MSWRFLEPGVRIAVNPAGNASVAANAVSLDLPLKRPFEPNPTGRFMTKLTADGSDLEYSSYLLYLGLGVDALALAPGASTSGAGFETRADVYVAGPTAEPRGIAVVGIAELAACAGDCGSDGGVEDEELRLGVEIALARNLVATCGYLDLDEDLRVTVPDLVGAAGAKLAECA